MTQVHNVVSANTEVLNLKDESNAVDYSPIVNNLVEQGLPQAFNPNTYLSKIAANYDITLDEARTCLKLAISELENRNKENKAKASNDNNEKLNAQAGYFYPRSETFEKEAEKDGMDNLNSFGSYNRLMFGIK